MLCAMNAELAYFCSVLVSFSEKNLRRKKEEKGGSDASSVQFSPIPLVLNKKKIRIQMSLPTFR